MKNLSTIPSNLFSISAVTIGALLSDDLNPAEQNAIGNWFMLIGQYLSTTASQQQVINNANNSSNNTNEHIVNNNELIKKVVNKMNKEINNINYGR